MLAAATGYFALLLVLLLWTKSGWGLVASIAARKELQQQLPGAGSLSPGRRMLRGTLRSRSPITNFTGDRCIYTATHLHVVDDPHTESSSIAGSFYDQRTAPAWLDTHDGPVELDLRDVVWAIPGQKLHLTKEISWSELKEWAPKLAAECPSKDNRICERSDTSVPVGVVAYVIGDLCETEDADRGKPKLIMQAPPRGELVVRESSPAAVLAEHDVRLIGSTISTIVLTVYTATLLYWLLL